MSIFISELAFTDDADLIGEAKIGILIASVAAGAIGYFVLRKALGASSS
jgi:NhaA family Na+:H+ antiporter